MTKPLKKIAIDCFYKENDCYSVGVVFNKWTDRTISETYSSHTKISSFYMPGQFRKRELKGVMSIISQIDLTEFDTIIVDGYVWLNDRSGEVTEGLGAAVGNLVRLSGQMVEIVGVAKTLFGQDSETYAKVYRGHSKNPIYVTSSDNSRKEFFAEQVKKMSGRFRFPALLKELDILTKTENKVETESQETKKKSWKHRIRNCR